MPKVPTKKQDVEPFDELADNGEQQLAEHAALARRLGVVSASKRDSSLRQVLAEERIRIYDRDTVEKYLADKAWGWLFGTAKMWGWFKLRSIDRTQLIDVFGSHFRSEVYSAIIPLPVLQTVAKLIDRMGNEKISFFVGAITDRPDPFLAVRLDSQPDELFVIERWDEPTFRDKGVASR